MSGDVYLCGLDGCRAGWVVVAGCKTGGRINVTETHVIQDPRPLFEQARAGEVTIAIDVPIGLSENASRQCDVDARRFLGWRRGTSVFTAPCRCCLGASNYADACTRNQASSGKMLSQQGYGILPKIGQIDALMTPGDQAFIREVHPEVSFAVLSGGPMRDGKTTERGIVNRLSILNSHGIHFTLDAIQRRRLELGRFKAQVDDIIDAAACLLSASRIAEGVHHTLGGNEYDTKGLRMEIVA